MMDEYAEGYMAGIDKNSPEPSVGASPRYIHSFRVGRAELMGKPIPMHISKRKVIEIEIMLNDIF
jgi:hypothetical protein